MELILNDRTSRDRVARVTVTATMIGRLQNRVLPFVIHVTAIKRRQCDEENVGLGMIDLND